VNFEQGFEPVIRNVNNTPTTTAAKTAGGAAARKTIGAKRA
jgi:hypothetical protein